MLKTQDQSPTNASPTNKGINNLPINSTQGVTGNISSGLGINNDWTEMDARNDSPNQAAPMDDFNFNTNMNMNINNVGGDFTWEMIGLGLEEPLPPQETIDELHQVYFEKVHPSIPMIHKYRYLAAMNLLVNLGKLARSSTDSSQST